MTQLRSVATARTPSEIVVHHGEGPQIVSVRGDDPAVAYQLFLKRRRQGVESEVLFVGDVKKIDVATEYVGDGSDTTFSGTTLEGPIVPGSFQIEATTGSPAIVDELLDGDLYLDGFARKRAGSGTFATMAGESMTVLIDEGQATEAESTITFATEATIGAAVNAINLQLTGGSAVAQGAQNVDLLTDTRGSKGSVRVVQVDAGITTKLGITAGFSGALAGTVDYFSGALTLDIPGGYAPATTGAKLRATLPGPYNLEPGATLVVDPDGGGDDTATWDATRATLVASGGSFAAMAAETMQVQFEDGEVQTITFGTEASIALAVALINSQLRGGYAVAQGAQDVDILSDVRGTSSRVRTFNVAAGITTKLGIQDDGDESGTGDCANIEAVTAAEVKTVVEADIDGITVEVHADGSFSLIADTSIAVDASSTTEAIFGLVTTTITAGQTELLCNYTKSQELKGKEVLQVNNMTQLDELVVYGLAASHLGLSMSIQPNR